MMETETQTEPQPIQQRFQCRHILVAGQRCGSPSLRRENFCFYHLSTRRPIPTPGAPAPALEPFTLPVLEDRPSIQLAISQVLARIASNELDPRRARLLIFGLNIAIRALPREPQLRTEPTKLTRAELVRDENAVNDLQDQMELDPTLGPLAPLAEYVPPEDRSKGFAQRLYEELLLRKCPASDTRVPTDQELQEQADQEATPTEAILPELQAVAVQNWVPHVRRSFIATDVGLLPHKIKPTTESQPLTAVSNKTFPRHTRSKPSLRPAACAQSNTGCTRAGRTSLRPPNLCRRGSPR